MRVTLVNKYYPPHLGGIEYHVRDLAEALAAEDDFDVRALVANEGVAAVRETVAGVEVNRLPRAFAYASTPVAFGMRRVMRAMASGPGATELFHLHFPYPWGEVSWLRAKTGVPTVLTYHSDIVRQRALLALYSPVLERVLRRVDRIIATSPNMVEASPFLARHADKCRVVPFGIDLDRFAATPAVLDRAAELRSEHDRPVVLFIGRLVYYKGADVLVRAMRSVDADLVMIGSGPLRADLGRLAEEIDVASRVTFLERATPDDLVAWYHAADVFCLPSVARSEAFGLVQIEAHAAGTPVVSTALSTGVPFANADGVSGLVVPPADVDALADALGTLVGDEALRARLGAQAQERARAEFGLARMVQRTVAVYREAVEV